MRDSLMLQKRLDKLWTVDDIMEQFSISRMTVFNWRATRKLPAIEIGGGERRTWRFVPDDVRKWARAQGLSIKG